MSERFRLNFIRLAFLWVALVLTETIIQACLDARADNPLWVVVVAGFIVWVIAMSFIWWIVRRLSTIVRQVKELAFGSPRQ